MAGYAAVVDRVCDLFELDAGRAGRRARWAASSPRSWRCATRTGSGGSRWCHRSPRVDGRLRPGPGDRAARGARANPARHARRRSARSSPARARDTSPSRRSSATRPGSRRTCSSSSPAARARPGSAAALAAMLSHDLRDELAGVDGAGADRARTRGHDRAARRLDLARADSPGRAARDLRGHRPPRDGRAPAPLQRRARCGSSTR